MREIIKNANMTTATLVFVGLVILTVLTVLLSGLDVSDTAHLIIALSIATIKGSLVLYYFMHLSHEPMIFKVFLAVAFLTLLSILVLTFSDYSFRGIA